LAWVKLDDNFHWHPKVAPLSDGAYRLYVGGLCYCNRFGHGDSLTMPQILGLVGNARRAERLINELTSAKLWRKSGTHYTIHDYFSYQPDPKKVFAGRVSAATRAQHAVEQVLNPVPVPSRPVTGVLPPVVPLRDNGLYGLQATAMHVEGLHPLKETLKKVMLQSDPRRASA
jgi:hypothetical protein